MMQNRKQAPEMKSFWPQFISLCRQLALAAAGMAVFFLIITGFLLGQMEYSRIRNVCYALAVFPLIFILWEVGIFLKWKAEEYLFFLGAKYYVNKKKHKRKRQEGGSHVDEMAPVAHDRPATGKE